MTEASVSAPTSGDSDGDPDVTVSRWDYPAVDESAAHELKGVHGGHAHLLTARQVDALQEQAHEEAYARGFDEGLAAGQKEVASRIERLDRLALTLARPLNDLDHSVENDLLELAAALAQQILHRELKSDPRPMINAVQDCLDVLPSSARDVTLHLNPADAAFIQDHFSGDSERPWRIAESTALSTGDLRVTSESSQIDGRLQTRLAEIIASGVERMVYDDECGP
ncbi:MAG: FliH/SctL family protein [Gammaproteobacteria bacterium]